jgi:hypothetical protein
MAVFNRDEEASQKWALKWCESREEILHAKQTQLSQLEAWKEERDFSSTVEMAPELLDNTSAMLRNAFFGQEIQTRRGVLTDAELAAPCNHLCIEVDFDDGKQRLEVGIEGPRPDQVDRRDDYFQAAAMLYPAIETNCAALNLSPVYFFVDGGSSAKPLAQAAGVKRKCEAKQPYRTR